MFLSNNPSSNLSSNSISWDDVVRERNRREDEGVARKFERFAYLGRGHLRTDIVRVIEPLWRKEE
jgi:hypothetical protein